MLSPRVVRPGIPGAFDCISSPMGRDNKRFDVTQHPKDGGSLKRSCKSLEPSLKHYPEFLGIAVSGVPYAHISLLLIHCLNSVKRFLILGEMALYKVLDITRQKIKTVGVTRK